MMTLRWLPTLDIHWIELPREEFLWLLPIQFLTIFQYQLLLRKCLAQDAQ